MVTASCTQKSTAQIRKCMITMGSIGASTANRAPASTACEKTAPPLIANIGVRIEKTLKNFFNVSPCRSVAARPLNVVTKRVICRVCLFGHFINHIIPPVLHLVYKKLTFFSSLVRINQLLCENIFERMGTTSKCLPL